MLRVESKYNSYYSTEPKMVGMYVLLFVAGVTAALVQHNLTYTFGHPNAHDISRFKWNRKNSAAHLLLVRDVCIPSAPITYGPLFVIAAGTKNLSVCAFPAYPYLELNITGGDSVEAFDNNSAFRSLKVINFNWGLEEKIFLKYPVEQHGMTESVEREREHDHLDTFFF